MKLIDLSDNFLKREMLFFSPMEQHWPTNSIVSPRSLPKLRSRERKRAAKRIAQNFSPNYEPPRKKVSEKKHKFLILFLPGAHLPYSCTCCPPLKKNEHVSDGFSCSGRKSQKFLGAVKIFRRVPPDLF